MQSQGFGIALLTRNGQAYLPEGGVLLQEDDRIHVMIPADAIGTLDHVLAGHHEGAH